MKTEIAVYNRNEVEIHEVIYIEYQDNIPHSIFTKHWFKTDKGGHWCYTQWDAFLNENDPNDLRLYKSGGGFGPYGTQYVPDYKGGSYWLKKGEKISGKMINIKKIKIPVVLQDYFGQKTHNPFEIGEEVYHYEFCDVCNYHSYETCWDHKYEDDEGDLRYIHNNESAE